MEGFELRIQEVQKIEQETSVRRSWDPLGALGPTLRSSGADPQHRFLVSSRLRGRLQQRRSVLRQAWQVIDLPERRADRPSREFLERHLDEVFLKAAAT